MKKRLLFACVLIMIGVWANNSSLLVKSENTTYKHIAHRGVHQTYAGNSRTIDGCHASPIAPITHGYFENTLPSIQAAIGHGAQVVEIDVHLTPDNVFAVFHDWTLDCKTNGTGVTHKTPFSVLETLDVAYNYSTDGTTFPLRGQGIGMIPTLPEVLNTNPTKQFLINFKSNRKEEGIAFAKLVKDNGYANQIFGIYGNGSPVPTTLNRSENLRGFTRQSIKKCLIRYGALGWSGYVPKPCRNALIAIPQNYAKFLWGWPHLFTKRLNTQGSDIILLAPLTDGFVNGFDTPEQLDLIPASFSGYIWTNRIELINPTTH